jgi:hypothetical protein
VSAEPWLYAIRDATGTRLAFGEQWTNLNADPYSIAAERMGVYALPLLQAGRGEELTGLVCQVRRRGDDGRPAECAASTWVQRFSARS